MPRIKLEVGQQYDVNDARKGKFRMRVTRVGDCKPNPPYQDVGDDFVDGVITSGVARFITRDDKYPGAKVSTRRSFARFRKVPKEASP